MKAESVLLDTGPLVALLNRSDPDHSRCAQEFEGHQSGLPTSWPVLTEVFYLLRKQRGPVAELVSMLTSGLLVPLDLDAEFSSWLSSFLERFDDREPQLADASLVYLAEREVIDTVFTLDRRDFAVYRTSDNRALRVVPDALASTAA